MAPVFSIDSTVTPCETDRDQKRPLAHGPTKMDVHDALDIQIRACRRSITRSRYVFTITCIACAFLSTGAFNLYFGWDRILLERTINEYNLMHERSEPQPIAGDTSPILRPASARDLVEKQQLAELARQRVNEAIRTNVPLLGFSFNAGDLGIVGGLGLFILALWGYYSYRVENTLVGRLCEFAAKNTDEKALILEALRGEFVFTVTRARGSPYGIEKKTQAKHSVKPSIPVAILLWLPVGLLLIIFGGDIYSLCTQSCSLPEDITIWTACGQVGRQPDVVLRLVVQFLMLLAVGITTWRAYRYTTGTLKVYADIQGEE